MHLYFWGEGGGGEGILQLNTWFNYIINICMYMHNAVSFCFRPLSIFRNYTINDLPIKRMEHNYDQASVALLGYDSIWTLALALEKTLRFANKIEADNVTGCSDWQGELVPLEHFNYSNGYMGCVIRWALGQTDFAGASVSSIKIYQQYVCRC